MQSIPCWIISLNPKADMPQSLAQSLQAQDVTYEFFAAVDARKGIPPLESGEMINEQKTLLRHQRKLSNPEIGCYLSHFRAIKKAWELGLEKICIIEEDVVIENTFSTILKKIEKNQDDWDMIRLMGLRIRKRKIVSSLDEKHILVLPERGWCGTQAYVLNRKGMAKIIKHAGMIFEPIDKVYDHFWEFNLRVMGIEPHIAYETDHPTTVAKNGPKITIPLHVKLLAPFLKLAFSISRHSYLKSHKDVFYPADKPTMKIGNTVRLR